MGEIRPEIEQKYQLGILYFTFTAKRCTIVYIVYKTHIAVKTCNIMSSIHKLHIL